MLNKPWKTNNSLSKLNLLQENKEAKINKLVKNGKLEPSEGEVVKAFFKKHSNLESKIDWNNENLDFNDFKEIISQSTKSSKVNTIPKMSELKKGVDYKLIAMTENYIIYKILSHKGAVCIASNNVLPKTASPLPDWYSNNTPTDDYKVLGKYNGKMIYSGAKWCISMNHTSQFWDTYTNAGDEFYFVLLEDEKFAVQINKRNEDRNYIWNSADDKLGFNWERLGKYWKEIKEAIIKIEPPNYLTYNEETKRYDCVDPDEADIENDLIKDGKFIWKLGVWNGGFYCGYNENLISLEGAPATVEGNFNCVNCMNLTSLTGAPTTVGGNFCCSFCDNLTSLNIASTIVKGDFDCGYNKNLISLEGAPATVEGNFNCVTCMNLTSLDITSTVIGGDFDCSDCKLTSLKGAPQTVKGNFDCLGNPGYPFTNDPYKPSYYKPSKTTRRKRAVSSSKLRVGGTIFYIDRTATGATYKFYDINNKEIVNWRNIDDLKNAYYYEVSGTPNKDKFYVADSQNCIRKFDGTNYCIWSNKLEALDSSKIDVSEIAGTVVGTGRRNTNYIFTNKNNIDYFPNGANNNYSCWDFCKECNTNNINGCKDWFVPSIAECKALRESGIWGSSNNAWIVRTEYGINGFSGLWSSSACSETGSSWSWYVGSSNSLAFSGSRNSQGNRLFLALVRAF